MQPADSGDALTGAHALLAEGILAGYQAHTLGHAGPAAKPAARLGNS